MTEKPRGITRPDLWDKALEEVSRSEPRGVWTVYLVWREYWRLLRGEANNG